MAKKKSLTTRKRENAARKPGQRRSNASAKRQHTCIVCGEVAEIALSGAGSPLCEGCYGAVPKCAVCGGLTRIVAEVPRDEMGRQVGKAYPSSEAAHYLPKTDQPEKLKPLCEGCYEAATKEASKSKSKGRGAAPQEMMRSSRQILHNTYRSLPADDPRVFRVRDSLPSLRRGMSEEQAAFLIGEILAQAEGLVSAWNKRMRPEEIREDLQVISQSAQTLLASLLRISNRTIGPSQTWDEIRVSATRRDCAADLRRLTNRIVRDLAVLDERYIKPTGEDLDQWIARRIEEEPRWLADSLDRAWKNLTGREPMSYYATRRNAKPKPWLYSPQGAFVKAVVGTVVPFNEERIGSFVQSLCNFRDARKREKATKKKPTTRNS